MKTTNDVVIRALAVLLVLNSHLDPFYANKMLSGGGALANALFFFLSGVGISASSASAELGFWDTLKKAISRVPRVYAPAWVVGLLLTLSQIYQFDDAQDFFHAVVWPTRYWFLYALVLFYPVVVLAAQSLQRAALVFGVLLVAYVVWYTTALDLHRLSVEDYYFRWINYLGLMLFGATLAHWPRLARFPGLVLLGLSTAAFVGVKWGLPRLHLLQFQFLFSVLLFPFVYGAYWSLRDVALPALPAQAASFIARHSLEVYVIQVPVIHWLASEELHGLAGVALVTAMSFALAPVLRHACRWILRS